MRRRELLALVGGTMLVPERALAQAGARVGWLSVAPHPGIEGFRAGMRELGWVEGNTLTIDYAYGEGKPEHLPELARALANSPVQLVVASGSDAVVAARAAITGKPLIGVSSGKAMGIGENLSKPPDNLTGVALLFDVIAAKWVEALAQVLPPSSSIGVVHDASVANAEQFENVRHTASLLGYQVRPFRFEDLGGLEHAIVSAGHEGSSGLIFVSSPIFTANAARVTELVQASRLPAIFESRWLVEKGGLMSYGPDFDAVFRRTASLADRLLKGARTADLPIEQPTKFHFSLNRLTAHTLGVEIPLSLLARADEVIE